MRTNSSGRRAGAIALALTVSVALAACGDAGSDDAVIGNTPGAAPEGPADFQKDADGILIAGSSLWDSNLTAKLANDAAIYAAEARGATVNLLQANPQDPVNTTVSNLDTALAMKPDAAFYFPVDPDALTAPVIRANSAGIPVVSSELTNAPATAIVHGGREAAAIVVAQAVCDLLPDGGNIVYGDYAYPDPNIAAYKTNFTEALAECRAGDIKIAEEFQNKTDDVAGAIDPALAALQLVPDAKAIVNYSDVTAIGASRAAQQLGVRDQLKIFGLNLGSDGLDALTKGTIDYSMYQPVAAQGQYVANLAIDLALGKKVPKYSTFWLTCYSTATVDQVPDANNLLAMIKAGQDAITEPQMQLTTSDTELVTTAPAGVPGCPIE